MKRATQITCIAVLLGFVAYHAGGQSHPSPTSASVSRPSGPQTRPSPGETSPAETKPTKKKDDKLDADAQVGALVSTFNEAIEAVKTAAQPVAPAPVAPAGPTDAEITANKVKQQEDYENEK